jgi:hypothetical protein
VNFVRGHDYVLDFSDCSFAAFFASDLDVDIDDSAYADQGEPKGKRLRCFLQNVDDANAVRALRALSEHRAEWLALTGQADPAPNAAGRFLTLIARLSGASPNDAGQPPQLATDWRLLSASREDRLRIASLPAQDRGHAFEDFLRRCFDTAGLKAREPFRDVGEQIDGSFLPGDETYLLEAKWQVGPTGAGDLHAFHGKLDQTAVWARGGLFVSYHDFRDVGLSAFGAGKRLVCMGGRNLQDALDRQIPLRAVLERKVRRAAETGRSLVSVGELFGLQTMETAR